MFTWEERFLPGSFVQHLLTLEQGVNNEYHPQGWLSSFFWKNISCLASLGALLWALGKLDPAGGFFVLVEGQDKVLAVPSPTLALTVPSLLGQQSNSL